MVKKVVIGVVGFFVLMGVIGSLGGGSKDKAPVQASGSVSQPAANSASAAGTAPAPAAAARQPVELNGSGKRVADVTLPSGLARFSLRHTGTRNFSVWLMDSDGKRLDLLANQIGAWDGEKAVRIDKAGPYVLDVTADGDWQVVVR